MHRQSFVHFFSRWAFASIRLQKWREVEPDCSEALTWDANNAKARYRRALAHYELGNVEQAFGDLQNYFDAQDGSTCKSDACELMSRVVQELPEEFLEFENT